MGVRSWKARRVPVGRRLARFAVLVSVCEIALCGIDQGARREGDRGEERGVGGGAEDLPVQGRRSELRGGGKLAEVDFGFGSPEGVRSGGNNRFDGMVYLYQGKSGGRSIDVEISLDPSAMEKLEKDQDFLFPETTVTA